jgi:hypothetical protein
VTIFCDEEGPDSGLPSEQVSVTTTVSILTWLVSRTLKNDAARIPHISMIRQTQITCDII